MAKRPLTEEQKAQRREKRKAWYAIPENRAQSIEKAKAWQRANAERKRQYNLEWRAANPEKSAEYSERWKAQSPEKRRATWIKSKYKLTDEQYQQIVDHPQTCDACGTPFTEARRHIDHCHETGRFRGLLCGACNQAAGLLRDSPERAVALAAYLRKVASLV